MVRDGSSVRTHGGQWHVCSTREIQLKELRKWTSKEVAHSLPAKDRPSISSVLYVSIPCSRPTVRHALLVAQLAYEGKGGPELAYRFEWFRG